MIVTKEVIINGKEFVHTYSDCGLTLERDGVLYTDALDPKGFDRKYVEREEPETT